MPRSAARARPNRWLRWGRIFFLAILTGLLTWWLYFHAETSTPRGDTIWWLFIAIGTLPYLLCSTLEGFVASWQSEDVFDGLGSGCLVSGMSFLVLSLVFGIAVILPMVFPPPCQPNCHAGVPPYDSAGEILIGFLFFEGVLAGFGGLLGGWMGGLLGAYLGDKRAMRAQRSSAPAAKATPPGKAHG